MQFPGLDFSADEIDAFDANCAHHKWPMDYEVWLPLGNLAGVSVSNFGRLKRERVTARGIRKVKIDFGALNIQGYRKLYIRTDSRYRTFLVHRLIALAFLGPEPRGHQVHHIDANRENNRLDNLQYVRSSDNVREANARREERRRLERLLLQDNLANP